MLYKQLWQVFPVQRFAGPLQILDIIEMPPLQSLTASAAAGAAGGGPQAESAEIEPSWKTTPQQVQEQLKQAGILCIYDNFLLFRRGRNLEAVQAALAGVPAGELVISTTVKSSREACTASPVQSLPQT